MIPSCLKRKGDPHMGESWGLLSQCGPKTAFLEICLTAEILVVAQQTDC